MTEDERQPNDFDRPPIRWWPAVLILAAAAVALAVVWLGPAPTRQARYIRTAIVAIWTGMLFPVWLLLLSRARWEIRVGGLAVVVLIVGGMAAAFEIRGVTGDLLPILEPRWKPRHTVHAIAASETSTNSWRHLPGEFTAFYGPHRDATVSGIELGTNWAARPPEVLWKQPVGQGWSGFAVAEGLAITQEQRDESEYVIAYEVATGRTVWTHADPARYATTIAGEGPRATPAIRGPRVYTFGATGILNCLDFDTGHAVWSRDTIKENNGDVPDWGLASSPLLVDDLVIVSVGGSNGRSLVAYKAADGQFAWGAGAGGADYSSPVLAELLGQRQVLIFNTSGVVGQNLQGKILWTYPWPGGHPHITPPRVIGTNLVLATSGYGTGAELLQIERGADGAWSATRVWKSIALKSKFGPVFIVGDYIYGLDDGIFTCLDLKTGRRQWKDGRFGHGQGLLVGDLILLTSEKGELVLIRPDPEALVELDRFPLFTDKTWNPPALAGEYLLARNHKEAACLRLPLRKSGTVALGETHPAARDSR